VQLTNSREVAAFFIARAIVDAIHFLVTPVLLAPLYLQLIHADDGTLINVVTSALTFATWVVTLPLFLVLRGRAGGVPPIVAQGRWDSVISSTAEVMSYFSAVLIAILALWILGALVQTWGYGTLLPRGRIIFMTPAWFVLSTVSAVVAFLIFLSLRGAAPDVTIPDVFD
jgi:hypothetical protein